MFMAPYIKCPISQLVLSHTNSCLTFSITDGCRLLAAKVERRLARKTRRPTKASETSFISLGNTMEFSLSPCHFILCYPFPSCSYVNTNCVWLHFKSLETSDVKNANNNNFLTILFHCDHQLHLQDKISNFNHMTQLLNHLRREKKTTHNILSFNYVKGYS